MLVRGLVRRTVAAIAIVLSIGTAPILAFPADPAATSRLELEEDPTILRLSLDPYISIESGSDIVVELASVTGRLEDIAFRSFRRRSLAGLILRGGRTLLLDMPLAWWFGILQHEAFGHGGRAREFGSTTGFHLGHPWSGREAFATFSIEGRTPQELLRIAAGGSESNGWTATYLERELAGGRRLNSMTLLLLVSSRLVTSDYVLRTTPDPLREPARFFKEWNGGGDVANYLGQLNRVTTGRFGITPTGVDPLVAREYDRLEGQAIWNALDPGVWLSIYAVARQVIEGSDAPHVPLLRAGRWRLLPVLSADWTPQGGLMSLELIFGGVAANNERSPRWFSTTLRRGDGPAGPFGALGAATERFVQRSRFRLGGEAELWTRPGGGLGGGARLQMVRTGGALRGLFVEFGAKSAGHWPGRPAAVGPFLRLGYRID